MKTCLHELAAASHSRPFLSRRELLAWLAGAGMASALQRLPVFGQNTNRQRLGVCSICYSLRWPGVDRGQGSREQLLQFVEYCRQLGAGGVQTNLALPPDVITLLLKT